MQSSSITSKTEAIVAEIVSAVNNLCRTQCGPTATQIQNPGFSCGQDDNIVFRGELFSTQQSSSRVLQEYIQDWVRSAPKFVVQNVNLNIDPLCPTAIETLMDPVCGESSTPSNGAVIPVRDTGAIAAGWVIAALVLIVLIVVAILGLLYLRHQRNNKRAKM